MYKQLSLEDRALIEGYHKANYTQKSIAEQVGVDKSTISRELRRNQSQRGYRAKAAQAHADKRKLHSARNARLTLEQLAEVDRLLGISLSPKQIAGRLKLEGNFNISHTTIYSHIQQDKLNGGRLHEHKRHQKTYRHRTAKGNSRIPCRTDISERDAEVEARTRVGDFECDTVVGKNHQGAIVTVVDRASRMIFATIIPVRSASATAEAIIGMMKDQTCHTFTFDNGLEFARHQDIASACGATTYFAKPYHPWERGTNENANGLLREYFPKKTNFSTIPQDEFKEALCLLNHRPRKTLGYRSPIEAHFGTTFNYTFNPSDVALQI